MAAILDNESIGRAASDLDSDLIALRREIHQWPELAGDESRTSALVAERLRAAGLDVSTEVGGHGVVGVLDGAAAGPTVAYRADMDAVAPDQVAGGEATTAATTAATTPAGAAHLCGHDLHTAIGVGVAQVLARLREGFHGRVVFLFQPAEETLEGARAMIETGVIDRLAPQEIYALHCGAMPVGTLTVMPGVGMPGLDVGQIDLSGPDAGDAGQRLVARINDMSTVSYPATPAEFAQLANDLRTPDGPLARFVFARARLASCEEGAAQVRLSVRAWPEDRHPEVRAEVRRLAASEGTARVSFPQQPFPAMVCSRELSLLAAAHLRDLFGPASVPVLHAAIPFHGEDFALFLRRVPGAMFFLGVSNPQTGVNGVPHSPHFAADETAIGFGVRAMAGLLSSRLIALAR